MGYWSYEKIKVLLHKIINKSECILGAYHGQLRSKTFLENEAIVY